MHDVFRIAHSVRMLSGSGDTAEVNLYGEIINNIPDQYKWDENEMSASDFKKAIDKVKAEGATKLFMRINSPGGVCTEAIAMRSILANAGFSEITILIEGLCASAATDIATLPNAHVQIAEGSEYMIHNPWCVAIGNANEIEHTIERLRNIEDMSRSFYVAKTGQSDERIKKWMDAETWFTADQAVECGFADEVLRTTKEEAIAACVSDKTMAVMKSLYRSVPEQVHVKAETAQNSTGEEPVNDVSNGLPIAGNPTEINNLQEENSMELKDLTIEQLRDGNPALYESIQNSAIEAERTRISDIDALTIPGYEDIAQSAKDNGTSAMDFQKQIVATMKQKGADFLANRKEETTPAQSVKGEAPASNVDEEKDEIAENAKSMSEIAKAIAADTIGGMF